MRYFMKFYLDCSIGTVELVEDSITLLSGNDERGTFHWIEVFDKQDLYKAHREGWEQCKMECIQECADAADDNLTAGMVKHAIASMEYKGAENDQTR